MAGFLYYLPGRSSVTPAELQKLGLEYAFVDLGAKHLRPVREKGPDGGRGVIVACNRRVDSSDCGYYAVKQEWKHHAGLGVWVGMTKGKVPGPEDLAHAKQLPGKKLRLADDREWLVPVARRWSANDDPQRWFKYDNVLPRRLDMSNDGDLVVSGRVIDRYAQLWTITEAHAAVRIGKQSSELFDGDSAVITAAKVLQANYAVGLLETLLLGLFTQENFSEIFEILGDWASFDLLLQKKNQEAADLPPSSSGPEDTLLDTDPRSPTS